MMEKWKKNMLCLRWECMMIFESWITISMSKDEMNKVVLIRHSPTIGEPSNAYTHLWDYPRSIECIVQRRLTKCTCFMYTKIIIFASGNSNDLPRNGNIFIIIGLWRIKYNKNDGEKRFIRTEWNKHPKD